MTSSDYQQIVAIVRQKFRDIVLRASPVILPSGLTAKVRLFLIDQSFIDVWLSGKGRYAYRGDLYPDVELVARQPPPKTGGETRNREELRNGELEMENRLARLMSW